MSDEYERKVKIISRILLESSNKMIKEQDFLTYVQDEVLLNDIISDVNSRFENIGYEIIKTKFLNHNYYILTSNGIHKDLTPQMYGILAIIIGLNKEISRNLTLKEVKELFSDTLEEIEFLKENQYLKEYVLDDKIYLIPTPISKVIFKNMIQELNIDTILRNLGIE